jgi:hypothetical protein
LRNDDADYQQDGNEPQPGNLHQNQKIEPPPDAPPAMKMIGRAEAAFILRLDDFSVHHWLGTGT